MHDLVVIREIFGLSRRELADLLHLRPRSIAKWEQRGIPQEIRATVERIADIARVLEREARPSRIPAIVRTRDAWLGDRTVLDVLRTDGVDPIYSYLARLFRYASCGNP